MCIKSINYRKNVDKLDNLPGGVKYSRQKIKLAKIKGFWRGGGDMFGR